MKPSCSLNSSKGFREGGCCVDDVSMRSGVYMQSFPRQQLYAYSSFSGKRSSFPLLQQFKMSVSSRYVALLQLLLLCFFFVLFFASEPSHAHIVSRGLPARSPSVTTFVLKHLNGKHAAEEGEGESTGSMKLSKNHSSSSKNTPRSVIDPFSAAQMLTREKYKNELTARVHLRGPRELEEAHEQPKTAAAASVTRAATTAAAEAKKSPRSSSYSKTSFLSSVGKSFLQSASNKDNAGEEKDDAEDESETFLQLPSRYTYSNVKPHFPVLPEFFSDEEKVEAIEQQRGGRGEQSSAAAAAAADPAVAAATQEEKSMEAIPAASLVQASAAAEESTNAEKTKQESEAEAEEEEDREESEHPSKADKSEEETVHTAAETAEANTQHTQGLPETETSKEEHEHKGEEEKGHAPPLAIPHEKKEAAASEQEAASSKESSSKSAPEEEEELQSIKESGRTAALLPESAKETEKETEKEAKEETKKAEETHKEMPVAKHPPKEEKAKKEEEKEETEEQKEKEEETHKEPPAAKTAVPVQTPPKEKETKEKEEEREKEEKAKEEEQRKKEIAERATKLANLQRMEQEALLKLHMLGEGGPRENVITPTGASAMSVQDEEQHRQLAAATETAQHLATHLKVQHKLKQREMQIKQKEMAHLNQLKHLQVLMQSAVSGIWGKLASVQSTLKQLTAESEAVSKRFLKETNNRVLRPQELPQAETSAEDKQQQMLLAKQTGASPLDCPVECAPSTCDNKPTVPTHCFRYDLIAGGGGFRTCAPFTNQETATCPQSYTRCAMAAPVRGRTYELLVSPPDNPLPQALFIKGNNMHSCLRLVAVHKNTECAPTDAQAVLAILNDTQNKTKMPPPKILSDGAVFENIQVASPGIYKLCLLQYWAPPKPKAAAAAAATAAAAAAAAAAPGEEKVMILGADEIGVVHVLTPEERKPAATEQQTKKEEEEIERETKEIEQPITPHEEEDEEEEEQTKEKEQINEKEIKEKEETAASTQTHAQTNPPHKETDKETKQSNKAAEKIDKDNHKDMHAASKQIPKKIKEEAETHQPAMNANEKSLHDHETHAKENKH